MAVVVLLKLKNTVVVEFNHFFLILLNVKLMGIKGSNYEMNILIYIDTCTKHSTF